MYVFDYLRFNFKTRLTQWFNYGVTGMKNLEKR